MSRSRAARPVSTITLCLALLAPGCFGGETDLPLGAQCGANDDCAGDLICQYGRCRSECDFDHECPDGTFCVAVAGDPDVRVCTLVGEGCGEGGQCPDGLECVDGACLNPCDPNEETLCGEGRECIDGVCIEISSCITQEHCWFDCICEEGRCIPPGGFDAPEDYCIDGVDPTSIDGDLEITTTDDEADCGGSSIVYDDCAPDGMLSLREALLLAAALPGPHHIVVSPGIDDRIFPINLTTDETPVELPPVPSLTYLDGGPFDAGQLSGMTLTNGGSFQTGLTLDGDLTVVSDVAVEAFLTGFRVVAGSRDVHLFRIRAVRNGEGVVVERGPRDVTLGLGRELAGIEPHLVDFPIGYFGMNPNTSHYGWNTIIAGGGDGIHATGVRDLAISGTAVGYDHINNTYDGNGGAGIELEDVQGATIGAHRLTATEIEGLRQWRRALLDPDDLEILTGADPSQTYVVVCSSAGAGVLIDGGGDIEMPGVMIGETPQWLGGGTNEGPSLRVVRTEGPVVFGPSMNAAGDDVLLYSFIYSTSNSSIEVEDTEGEFSVRATLVQHNWGAAQPVFSVTGANAAVRWYHVTVEATQNPSSIIDVTSSSGIVEIVNTRLGHDSVFLLSGDDVALGSAVLRGNVRRGSTAWCDGTCDTSDQNHIDAITACRNRGYIPLTPECSWVDLGVHPTDVYPEFDVNGSLDGDFNGCFPDPGAFECLVDDCIFPC